MYRLLCIYETKEPTTPVLRIEVNLLGKSKSIAPFLRKISVEDLYKEGVDTPELLVVLNHAGLKFQPFIIPPQLVRLHEVNEILRNQKYSYYQPNGKGSVKKISCPLLSNTPLSLKNGSLLEGELYIDNLQYWHRGIRVRFKYQDTLSEFFPAYSPLPYLTNNGQPFLRNKEDEMQLLAALGDNFDSTSGILNLKNCDTVTLNDFTKKGWTVYYAKQGGSHSHLYPYSEPSGITWFSSGTTIQNNYSQQFLDGFLQSRNYSEYDGEISIFKKEDAISRNNETLAQQLSIPFEASELYAQDKQLSSEEVKQIKQTIDNKVLATLRPYQMEGVLWLQKQRKNNHGCLLADEMGLGKTLQVITHLCCLNTTNNLVIAPTSLTYNWMHEIEKFVPSLVNKIRIVSYDMLRIHLEEYQLTNYDTIVIDEAQVIKNRQTQKYQAVQALQCKHKIILTGTPIENSIEEIWSHFIMLMPQMKPLYLRLHQLNLTNEREAYIALTAKFLKPFILRRDKQSVLKDLPDLTEKTVYIDLSPEERSVYNRIHASILHALKTGLSGRLTSIALEGLLRLRQACVSTNLLPRSLSGTKKETSSKMQCALDYINLFKQEGRKVLVFSQFVSALHEMEALLAQNNVRFLTLYGDTLNRQSIVQKFQADESITAFLISLKAGGVGLNLTSADRVVLLDNWWNPAVEAQAMGRAHRIGQKNNVLVLKLVCKDTVEEKILQLQDKKRQTVDLFNNANERITLEDIEELLGC